MFFVETRCKTLARRFARDGCSQEKARTVTPRRVDHAQCVAPLPRSAAVRLLPLAAAPLHRRSPLGVRGGAGVDLECSVTAAPSPPPQLRAPAAAHFLPAEYRFISKKGEGTFSDVLKAEVRRADPPIAAPPNSVLALCGCSRCARQPQSNVDSRFSLAALPARSRLKTASSWQLSA